MDPNQSKIKAFLQHTKRHHWLIGITSLVLVIAVAYGFWFASLQIKTLTFQLRGFALQIRNLEITFGTRTSSLQENLTKTEATLSKAIIKEQQNVESINVKFGTFEEEVSEISGTVSTLNKLSQIDPELLLKYSKVFFLNEHYEPKIIREIPDEHKYIVRNPNQIHSKVWPFLTNMLNQALAEGEEIYVMSAYRSFGTQGILKGQYIITYGAGTANQFSADQGYSEHQLGTTADLITTDIGGTVSGFETTSAYIWLLNNAHKYGFTLSYPEGNAFYIFEPWHWRFVGVKLATHLKNTNQNFYDLEQREIDEHLISLFD